MNHESVPYKLWRILYPLLLYFLLDVLIIWMVQYLTLRGQMIEPGSFLALNTPAIGTILFLLASVFVCWRIYQNDHVMWSRWICHDPKYFPVLVLTGILASHGLSALISLVSMGGMLGTYQEIQDNVFMAHPALVIVQTVILAPVSEELLFRGILYQRLRRYIPGFWGAALISSAIFGLYHMNLAQGIFAFLFGILICAVYDKLCNLWAVIALHAGGNLISVVIVYTGFQYPEMWVYITGMIVALAGACALYWFLIRPLAAKARKELR